MTVNGPGGDVDLPTDPSTAGGPGGALVEVVGGPVIDVLGGHLLVVEVLGVGSRSRAWRRHCLLR